jgi:ATP-binding protein involved in chromosome partitioning
MGEPLKVPVLSLKGGTGKTTTCLDIARVLRDRGNKVGLLDVDIHASALPRALNLEKPPGYEALLGGKLRPIQYDGFEIFSTGLLFPEEAPNMWDGETKADAVRQIATTSIAWDEGLEYVVIDTPPTSGDEVQSLLTHLKNVLGAVIICQPNELAVLALAKTINVLRSTETPISGVVANMTCITCPNCGQSISLFNVLIEDIEKLVAAQGVRFLNVIPFGPEKTRRPYVERIVDRMLRYPPVVLREKKGGFSRWGLKKILRSLS